MSRLETMAERIRRDLPEFIKLIPPTAQSEGLYRRIRHIQREGECCGVPMTIQQLKEVLALAGRESVKKPLHFLCVVLDRVHIEKTLENASKRARIDERVRCIAKYIKFESEWQVRALSGLILGRYSMDDLMTATEIACRKNHPARYLLGIFKRGYLKPCPKPASVL